MSFKEEKKKLTWTLDIIIWKRIKICRVITASALIIQTLNWLPVR